ncbi:MAG: polyphenol oxidase family protein [Clostridiales bacterium]|nr:polyphenol oxidase family protein [Clostridiales bacterium]
MDFSFYRIGEGLWYRCDKLSFPHCFGAASGGLDTGAAATMDQVHGDVIAFAEETDNGRVFEGCDALITSDPKAVIAAKTADCVPLLMEAADAGICAAVHAGWRGTIKGIAPKVFRELIKLGAEPCGIKIAIGAAARFESYEVQNDFRAEVSKALGEEICRRFVREDEKGVLRADVPGINIYLLKEAGAAEIFDCGFDTISDLRFRSYRREGRAVSMYNAISPSIQPKATVLQHK